MLQVWLGTYRIVRSDDCPSSLESLEMVGDGTWSDDKWLGPLAALPESLGLIPATHMGLLGTCNSSSRGSSVSSGLPWI